MDLLDLVHEKGLIAKRAANTQGGEYHSPCPDHSFLRNLLSNLFNLFCQ